MVHAAHRDSREKRHLCDRIHWRRVVACALLWLLGIATAVGITSIIVQFCLLVAPAFLVNWYAWLTVDVVVIITVISLRRRSRALSNGVGTGVLGLTIGIVMLAIGQTTWHYQLTPSRPSVDHHPRIDAIFLGSYWRTPLGRAQAANELTAFHVFNSSGWWHLLATYGVAPLRLTSCAVVGTRLRVHSLSQLVSSAALATGTICPGSIPLSKQYAFTGQNPPEIVIFAGPTQFLGQHLSESGWNFPTTVAHHQVRAVIVLDGSLKIAQGSNGKLTAITPVEDTTLTLSHELAESTTSLGKGSISVAASTLSRFTITTGATILYALSSQWGYVPQFFNSQPTDILQLADACSPGQPAFVPSPATTYRFSDGIGMVSILSRSGNSCENIHEGSVIRFPTS
ncbi:hypothetical protein [Ferrimicrobium acidiphilum]|uniref:hypothetical protein n=1 Tax=Ferrimicrobium acidiphilum TaxID=121039 RepID=UPI0023F507B2|nr:hypothetical protein [Ferrimicrobium acidiphilum]